MCMCVKVYRLKSLIFHYARARATYEMPNNEFAQLHIARFKQSYFSRELKFVAI